MCTAQHSQQCSSTWLSQGGGAGSKPVPPLQVVAPEQVPLLSVPPDRWQCPFCERWLAGTGSQYDHCDPRPINVGWWLAERL